jgi:hypothetical protein
VTYRYRKRTVEDVDAHLRRAKQGELVRRAYRGDTTPLSEALRADGWHLVADLMERGTYRKRDGRSAADDVAHMIAAAVWWRERLVRRDNGGRLPRNTRPHLIEEACTDWAEAGELGELNEDAQAGLPAAVRQILDREARARA